MGATLRLELFPSSLPVALDFYIRVMGFKLLRHEPDSDSTGYAHIRRDSIQFGLSTKPRDDYPTEARDPQARPRFRKWPTGAEIVIEVDDLQVEWQRVLKEGWLVETGLHKQGNLILLSRDLRTAR